MKRDLEYALHVHPLFESSRSTVQYHCVMYGLLTRREVKMAGQVRSIITPKYERGQYPAILTEHICYNRGQKSWDKFALLAFLGARLTGLQLHLPNLAPTPQTMLKTVTCNFL